MHFEYIPELVCSQKIEFDLNDNIVTKSGLTKNDFHIIIIYLSKMNLIIKS